MILFKPLLYQANVVIAKMALSQAFINKFKQVKLAQIPDTLYETLIKRASLKWNFNCYTVEVA